MKHVKRYTSNEFHDWQRQNLPSRFVLQDLDTWALLWSDSQRAYDPLAIVELKRSYIDASNWRPFEEDRPNYLALFRLAQKAGLPLWIVYFKKGERISDGSLFHLFRVTMVHEAPAKNWIDYEHKIITARKFRETFPNVF